MNRSLQHNTLNIKKLFYSACSAGLKTHCFKPLLLHKSWLHKPSISLLKATTKISASPILDEHLVNSNETVDLSGQRCLINVSGKDTIKFLNGLCTAALGTITVSGASLSQISGEKPLVFDLDGLYTVFLNPQGRVFFDAFIYLPKNLSNDSNFSLSHQIENQGLVLDVCMEMKDQVLSHLNRYKLISKVKLEEVSDKFKIVSLSGNQVFQELYPTSFFNNPLDKNMPSSRHLTSGQLNTLGASYGSWDHRWYSPELGIRMLLQKDFQPSNFFGNTIHISEQEYSFYANKLVKLGIAETSRGITSLSSLPMECNLELLNGINFRKGCYVGQELTIRTHHKGVIRKRIIPAKVLNSRNIPSLVGADIYDSNNDNTTKARKKSLGKIIYSSETHILILMRLEVLPSGVSEANLSFEASSENVKEQIDLHIAYPPWIQSILNPQ